MKTKRLTRSIRKKQDFCGFEIKKCRYQDIYGFEEYDELEENADCDLTLAIDKLGQLEDMEDDLGMDLLTAVNGAYHGIYYIHPAKENSGMEIMKGYINLSSVDKMEHSFIVEDTTCCLSFLDYGKKRLGGWALTKEELL